MKRNVLCLLLTASLAMTATLNAEPAAKTHRRSSTKAEKSGAQNAILEAANGWYYLKGEWVHPEGYKFVNGKILRTTAKTGKEVPKAPGKLALDNPQKVPAPTNSARTNTPATNPQSAADKAAADRRKNLAPTMAPQTGSHL